MHDRDGIKSIKLALRHSTGASTITHPPRRRVTHLPMKPQRSQTQPSPTHLCHISSHIHHHHAVLEELCRPASPRRCRRFLQEPPKHRPGHEVSRHQAGGSFRIPESGRCRLRWSCSSQGETGQCRTGRYHRVSTSHNTHAPYSLITTLHHPPRRPILDASLPHVDCRPSTRLSRLEWTLSERSTRSS
jgi:hypothetical protein